MSMSPDDNPRHPGEPAAIPPSLPPLRAFARGLSVVVSIPALLLASAGVGFGALARDGGLSIWHTVFITGTMFALPNQVVLVDQLARNETLLAAAFAVALAALRMLPMTATKWTARTRSRGRRRPAWRKGVMVTVMGSMRNAASATAKAAASSVSLRAS